jgi:DnaJ-class molecular chaperone
MNKDYYNILELTPQATDEEIKKSFRSLSLQYHPDKNPQGSERFKEINEAYQTLSDPQKKRIYDIQRSAGSRGGNSWNDIFASTEGMFSGFGFAEDIFERREQVIQPLEVQVFASIKDAAFGATKQINYKRRSWCEKCAHTHIRCSNCGGSGIIVQVKGNDYFRVEERTHCPVCRGSGSIKQKTSNCPTTCQEGFILEDTTLTFEIPRGMDKTGMYKMRHAGHESHTKRGQRGDVIVKIIEQPEENYERVGNDLVITQDIRYIDMVVGASKTLSLFDDKNLTYEYKIDKWFDTDSLIKVCDGPFAGGKTYIRAKLYIPKQNLNEEQLEILKRICED